MTCPECGWDAADYFGVCDECAVKFGVLGTLVHERRTLRFTLKHKKHHRTFNAKEFRAVEAWHEAYVARTDHTRRPAVTFEECRSEARGLARVSPVNKHWLVVSAGAWKFRFVADVKDGVKYWRLYDHEAKEAVGF